jgi:hypothetical protein
MDSGSRRPAAEFLQISGKLSPPIREEVSVDLVHEDTTPKLGRRARSRCGSRRNPLNLITPGEIKAP